MIFLKSLHIDITDLKIHEGIKVGDLSYDKIELLDPKKINGSHNSHIACCTENRRRGCC